MREVYVKNYPTPAVDYKEALRYAGCRGEADGKTLSELYACFAECEAELSYRVCYAVLDIETLLEVFSETEQTWLIERFSGTEKAVMFCATVGLGIDRLIRRYSRISPAKALLFQALGAERIESLCNTFCKDLQTEYSPLKVGARFSPGYGNIPLETQKTVCSVLDCSRKIGVSLNDSLLMSPSKSVTAFVPIGKKLDGKNADCKVCEKKDCALRKE